MMSTGTARKNSTNVPHSQLTARIGDNRPTPSRHPSTSANTIDAAAAVRVPSTPGST